MVVKEEHEYICQLPNATITFRAKKNDYVNVICEGSNINCTDLPYFDFASGQPLPSIGLKYCPPSILRCINDVVEAPSINRVTLLKMTEPLSGEDVGSLGSVNALTLRDARVQRTLPITVIKNLPTLREVRIGGGNMQLLPHAFEGSPPLTYLEFNEDKLTSIPPDSFNGLSSLIHLNIWGNNIVNISVGSFKGLDELRKLSLSTNKIKYIEPGTLDDLPKLGDLYLMKNQLLILPDGLLGNLKELQNITLKFNDVELTFDDRALSNLPSLKKIILESNKIRRLPESLFSGSQNIEYLSLSYNLIEDLPPGVFSTLSSLKYLGLKKNRVKELSKTVFYGIKNLEFLEMSFNHLENLPGDLFAGLTHLKEIHFDHNSIVSIASTTFYGLSKLETLSLGGNKLSLNVGYSTLNNSSRSYISPFATLTKLKNLNLSGNEISTIFDDWRLDMIQLENLNLSYNKFTTIMFDQDPAATYFISSNLTVDLRNNEIHRILVNPGTYERDSAPQLRKLLLDYNPFRCDCHMYGVKLRLDGDVYMPKEPKLIVNDARCSLPLDLKGVRIKDVPVSSLVCEISDTISDSCTTLAKPDTNELILNCPKFPTELPDTKHVALLEYFNREPTITVKSKRPPISLHGFNVHKLDLSNAGLKSIDFKPSKDLKVLDLSYNDIKVVPVAFLEANISLYLVNNSLECNCGNAEYIATLKSYKYVYNATCDGVGPIDQLDVQSLCNMQKALAVSLGICLSILFCAVFTSIIIYKYFNEIIIFMITRGICKSCVKNIKSDKIYDVFISFAHEDLALVQDILLPKLEKEFGQNVCVHYRDWVVGELIPTQINASVENSRKTIIVLSKNFLESMWANLEFLTAHNLTRQENSSRIILILLDEELSRHSKLSAELKAYIKTNTYLLWGDPNFWKKLDRALERNSYSITWLDAFKQKSDEKKRKLGGLDVQLQNGQLVNLASPYPVTNSLPFDTV
ncbi:unnamed protein product [Arctia plantaginis]|uniref:TIR domain-containing protein n=1 Tax=Arctia plantaginis TaxID=874455 RepID=A0A8S1A7U4_ARCPL|nr:unnamed protein product [Arctia plantaginis]